MSLGAIRQLNGDYPPVYEAVAKSLLGAGILIVAAAGNESNAPYSFKPVGNPAACPSILSVAACDRHGRAASFSNRELDVIGSLNLTAPGVAVYSAWHGGGYKAISGTSMATPHVAGLAALYAERGGRALRGKKLWEAMIGKAKHLGAKQDFGDGLAVL